MRTKWRCKVQCKYSSNRFSLRRWVVVRCHFHSPAAFSLGKEPRFILNSRLGLLKRGCTLRRRIYFSPCRNSKSDSSEIEPVHLSVYQPRYLGFRQFANPAINLVNISIIHTLFDRLPTEQEIKIPVVFRMWKKKNKILILYFWLCESYYVISNSNRQY